MSTHPKPLSEWTPEEIAQAREYIAIWKKAGPELARIRREELRKIDGLRAIQHLCFDGDYTVPPRAPKPTSGLIEQQRWFMKAATKMGLCPPPADDQAVPTELPRASGEL